jgi:hypothetical protein
MFSTMGDVVVPIAGGQLPGILHVPPDARGVVIVGTAGDTVARIRLSAALGAALPEAGFGILEIDLLADGAAPESEDLFTSRLLDVASWLQSLSNVGMLPLGLFSVGIPCRALLSAESMTPAALQAVVCCEPRTGSAKAEMTHLGPPLLLVADRLPGEQIVQLAAHWFERYLRAEEGTAWEIPCLASA